MSGVTLAAPKPKHAVAVKRDIVLPAVIFVVFALLPAVAGLTARQYLDRCRRAHDGVRGRRGRARSSSRLCRLDLAWACGLHRARRSMQSASCSAHGIGEALVALPAAILVSMLFAWLTGIVCLRTRGAYFIMITLAFGQMVYFIATSLAPYGGDNGLTIAARSTIAGWPLIKSDRAFYYFTLLCLLATYVFCRALVGSRFGRVLRGGKENSVRMATIGFNVRRFQLVAYIIAGGLGGFSGFLLARSDRVRGARLHVMAAIGRTDRHGDPRRRRHARRRAPWQRCLSDRGGMALGDH